MRAAIGIHMPGKKGSQITYKALIYKQKARLKLRYKPESRGCDAQWRNFPHLKKKVPPAFHTFQSSHQNDAQQKESAQITVPCKWSSVFFVIYESEVL